jgi:Calcium binding
MGWYSYLEDKVRFPFQAKCIVAKVVSPLLKGETVEVQGMAPEDACSADMLVLIRWQGRSMAVPLSQLLPIRGNKVTNEAIADWHYWVAQGYCLRAHPPQILNYTGPPKAHVGSEGSRTAAMVPWRQRGR